MKTCPTCQHTYPDDFSLCPRDGAPLTAQASETEAQLAAGLSRRFRLVRRLGKGGMGTVFLAEQIGVGNRPVALKVLNRKLLDDPDFLLRFQNEAASTGRIHHPNVVTIYESAQSDDGTPYIAMEFLEGESLRELIKQRGALPLAEVAEILQQAAGGLNAAHKLGIIHRDLKPDNIFLTHGDEGELVVKVVDFGIAKLRESGMHTQTGTVLGTPAYMSFEQASGMRSDELDARSDVYSLGVVVYETLTGRTPFHSDTPVGYLRKHLMEEPPPFRAVKPGLPAPPRIESVVMKALAKDRSQRYGSVLEFAQEFAQAAEAGSHPAAQPEPQREAAKPEPYTTVKPAPKTIVPAALRDTVAAKAVPETAPPSRWKWLVIRSRWKRMGIVASVIWILGAGIYTLKVTSDQDVRTAVWAERTCLDIHNGQDPDNECQKRRNDYLDETLPNDRIAAAIVAFVPVPLVWGFVYLVLFLVRWIGRAATAHPSLRKWLFVGSLIFLIVATAGGYWFYTSYIHRPDFTRSNKTTLADAYHVTAFRNGAYIIEHKGHRLTARCRESLTWLDGPDKPGRPLDAHDCTYMSSWVGKSIGDDLMRQEQNELVFSPWKGEDTVQTADFLDITQDELIRTGSGLGPAREEVKSPPAATVPAGLKPKVEPPVKELGPKPRATRVNPKDGLKYVWIPPGTFLMGCSPGDSECLGWEKPSHRVTVTKGFWLGQTEVTVGAYRRFAGSIGAQMPPAPDFNAGWNHQDMPIVDVSWDDATAYCGWAGGRLPTEAEWEYAARGGSTEARYGPINEIEWYDENSGQKTHEVGQKRANGFGLYDVLGNVQEWVNDWYDLNYYQNSPSQDPTGPASGQFRVLRGGDWLDSPRRVRVSSRFWGVPRYWYLSRFRCAREPVVKPTAESGAPQTEAGQQGPIVESPAPKPPEMPRRGVFSSAQDSVPRTARDYYNELKAANNFNHYKDTYVCFSDDDIPSFTVISRGSDIIEEMKKSGAVPDKVILQAKDMLFVETYYKGVSNKTQLYEPVGKDGTDWNIEFNAPIHHGRMLYSIDWTTGRYRLSVYALDHSKTIPVKQGFGKCEVIHSGK
jgi:serine/threonine-protein kinase